MKIRSLLLLPLMFGTMTLSACGETPKVELKYGQMADVNPRYIDYQTLKEKFENNETFLLTTYAQTCTCWSTFKSVLNGYINESHALVYAINYNAFHDTTGASLDTFGLNIQSGYTSFAIVNKGELVQNLKSGKDKIFTDVSVFTQFMSEMVILPKMFYVSLEQVDQLYATDATSAIYFARSDCGDCQYFDKNFLDLYSPNGKLYILDCEEIGIRVYEEDGSLTPESQIAWNNFKANYGLGSSNNPDFGYDTGYVPTLLLVKGNSAEGGKPTFLSGACYFNDSLDQDDKGYYVSNSYYTDERKEKLEYLADFKGTSVLKGLRLDASDVGTYGSYIYWNQESAQKYHDPLVKAFLDYALAKVDHDKFVS